MLESLISNKLFLTWLGAELFFVVSRSETITIVVKTELQRTDEENALVKRGLRRALALEFFLFVPASALIIAILSSIFLPKVLPELNLNTNEITDQTVVIYVLLGIISYGFPFAAIKKIIVQATLSTLEKSLDKSKED